jgi:hypothetical protein
MIGNLGLGQEHAQEFLDLSQAQAGREGDGGETLERCFIEENTILGLVTYLGDRPVELLIFEAKLSDQAIRFGHFGEPLLEFSGMLIDGLATALGLAGLLSDVATLAGKDGCRVADPSAER